MAKHDLYVGNPGRQVMDFSYFPINPDNVEHVVAHRHHFKSVKVPVGGQAKIPDLEEVNLNFILKQHEQYGMVEYDQVDRQKGNVSVVYAIDKPIPARALEKTVHKNVDLLGVLGAETRKAAAVAGHNITNSELEDVYATPAKLAAMEVEVVQTTRDQRDDSPEISEGVRVTPNPIDAGPRRGRRQAA